jgi:hypothetical protein
MLYLKKNNHFYCKFDPSTFTFMEVLSGPDQARAMFVTNEGLYNETLQRVQNHNFETTTAEEFSEFLSFVINRINQEG